MRPFLAVTIPKSWTELYHKSSGLNLFCFNSFQRC